MSNKNKVSRVQRKIDKNLSLFEQRIQGKNIDELFEEQKKVFQRYMSVGKSSNWIAYASALFGGYYFVEMLKTEELENIVMTIGLLAISAFFNYNEYKENLIYEGKFDLVKKHVKFIDSHKADLKDKENKSYSKTNN